MSDVDDELSDWSDAPAAVTRSAFAAPPATSPPIPSVSSSPPVSSGSLLETEAFNEDAVRQTLSNGVLTPRHRRFCQLAASGKSNNDIGAELGYTAAWTSTLLKSPYIADEIVRLQDKLFEDSIGSRLRSFAEPALQKLEECLKDKKNIYKKSEQLDIAKWLVEKLDGKATQKHDIGENVLGVLMDRLDGMKQSGKIFATDRQLNAPLRTVTETKPRTEEDLLEDWVTDYSVIRS